MPYQSATFTVPSNPFGGTINNDATVNGISKPNNKNFPTIPGFSLKLGTLAGMFNLMTDLVLGTATPSTPIDVDLTALTGLLGDAINVKRAKGVLVLNFSTTPGWDLLVGAATTNAWSAPFAGSATAKLTVGPGCIDPANAAGTTTIPGMAFLFAPSAAGLLTTGTSKILRLDPGTNPVAYGYALVGCDV